MGEDVVLVLRVVLVSPPEADRLLAKPAPGPDTGKSLTGTFVRDGVRDLGGCRGAQPPALGPRSGKFFPI